PGGDVFERPAPHQGGDAARVFHVLYAAPHGAPSFVECLAVLARDGGRDVVEVLLEDLLELEQVTRAYHGGHGTPGGERRPGCRDRLIDVTAGRKRYPSERLRGGGVRDFEAVASRGVDPVAADLIAQCPHDVRRHSPLESNSGGSVRLSIGPSCNTRAARPRVGSGTGGRRGAHLRAERAREDAARALDLDPDTILPRFGESVGEGDDALPYRAR